MNDRGEMKGSAITGPVPGEESPLGFGAFVWPVSPGKTPESPGCDPPVITLWAGP